MHHDISTRLFIRSLRPILVVFLGIVFFPRSASADIVVSLTGTIDAGSLNGVDLAAQSFEFQGLVTATEDADNFDDNGLFILESAAFDFAGGSRFEFDQNDAGFLLNYGEFEGQLGFSVGITAAEPEPEGYFNIIAYWDSDISDTGNLFDGFDPEVLTPFAYDAFDRSNAFLFLATNASGDELTIGELSVPSSYTAVPEPTTLPLICSALAVFSFRRRRARRFQREQGRSKGTQRGCRSE